MNLEYNLDKKIKNCVMNHPGSWMEPSDIAEWISKNYPKECEKIRRERGIDNIYLFLKARILSLLNNSFPFEKIGVKIENGKFGFHISSSQKTELFPKKNVTDGNEKNYQYVFSRDFLPQKETKIIPPFEQEEKKDDNEPITDLFVDAGNEAKESLKTNNDTLQTSPEKTTDYTKKTLPEKKDVKKPRLIKKHSFALTSVQHSYRLEENDSDELIPPLPYCQTLYEGTDFKDTSELRNYLRQNDTKIAEDYTEYDQIKEIIDFMADLRFRAEENYKTKSFKSKGKRQELPISWDDIDDIFTEQKNSDQPPRRLITKISEQLPLIERTIFNMRKVLKCERKKIPVSRAQELDSQCIQWLTKQPGRTAPEKAGIQQRIMAIVRNESFDTLENRVLKDFLHRCHVEAERYIQQYSKNERFKKSERLKKTQRLSALCFKSLALPEMAGISPLFKIPTPNYVLQQNPNYAKIWDFYKKLLHQTQLIEMIWPVRQKIFFEFLLLKLNLFIRFNGNVSEKKIFYSDLWIKESQKNGLFFSYAKWHYLIHLPAQYIFEFKKEPNHYVFSVSNKKHQKRFVFIFLPKTTDLSLLNYPRNENVIFYDENHFVSENDGLLVIRPDAPLDDYIEKIYQNISEINNA